MSAKHNMSIQSWGLVPLGLTLSHEQLTTLQSLIENANDRPARWINNLLCYHYNICRAPFTGDTPALPEGRRRPVLTPPTIVETSALRLYPNPAKSYVVVEYTSPSLSCQLQLKDATGRMLETKILGEGKGQWVMDTRGYNAGSYTVELHSDGRTMSVQKMILQ